MAIDPAFLAGWGGKGTLGTFDAWGDNSWKTRHGHIKNKETPCWNKQGILIFSNDPVMPFIYAYFNS